MRKVGKEERKPKIIGKIIRAGGENDEIGGGKREKKQEG